MFVTPVFKVRLDRDGFVHYNIKTSESDVAVEDVVRNSKS